MIITLLLLSSCNAFANSNYGFSKSYSTYKEALLNSLANRTKEIKSSCITKDLIKDDKTNEITEFSYTTESTSKEYYTLKDGGITVISTTESTDADVPPSNSEAKYTMKDENTLVREVSSSYYYKDQNGKIISNNDSFYIEEQYEDGLVKKVISYKKNGEEIPHHWEKHTLFSNPFGTELTRVIIDTDPSKRPADDKTLVPFYSITTCNEKEVGINNYKELYLNYIAGDWKVDVDYDDLSISINKDGTYKSNMHTVENGTWSLDESYNLVLKRNGDLFKFEVEFSSLSSLSIEHIEFGQEDNNLGFFELKK